MKNTFSVEILVENDWISLPEAEASTWDQACRNFKLVRKLYSVRPTRLLLNSSVLKRESSYGTI